MPPTIEPAPPADRSSKIRKRGLSKKRVAFGLAALGLGGVVATAALRPEPAPPPTIPPATGANTPPQPPAPVPTPASDAYDKRWGANTQFAEALRQTEMVHPETGALQTRILPRTCVMFSQITPKAGEALAVTWQADRMYSGRVKLNDFAYSARFSDEATCAGSFAAATAPLQVNKTGLAAALYFAFDNAPLKAQPVTGNSARIGEIGRGSCVGVFDGTVQNDHIKVLLKDRGGNESTAYIYRHALRPSQVRSLDQCIADWVRRGPE